MSAWLCTDRHLLYLASLPQRLKKHQEQISGYAHGDYDEFLGGPSARFAMLKEENLNSLRYRYPKKDWDQYGNTDVDLNLAPAVPFTEEEIGAALKSISCYQHQACEHDGWEHSSAYRYCRDLFENIACATRAYEAADWGAPSGPEGGVILESEAEAQPTP